jgi:Sec-independent protein secretion pathway component TatC
MTPEERELLNRSLKLAEENNKMLRSMRRSARFSSFIRLVYWLFIIGAAFGTYYFVQPYIAPIMKTYTDLQKSVADIKSTTSSFSNLPSWLGGKQ